MSTDEFEVDEDGYAYDASSDYYSNFEEEHQEQGNEASGGLQRSISVYVWGV